MPDKDAYIGQLEARIQHLEKENSELKEKLNEVVLRLKYYENPHTPPSLRRFSLKKTGKGKSNGGKPGRKKGHEGVTRETLNPNEWIEVTEDKCPKCGSKLGKPISSERKVIIDVPEPQPLRVIEFTLHHYKCNNCHEEIIASHPDCPSKGIFGRNILSQVALMKYKGRLPHRKIKEFLKGIYGIDLSTATIFDFTRRVSESLRGEYERILKRIRKARVVHGDETGIKVNGKKYWIWVFTTGLETLFVITKSRGEKVLKRTLKGFDGIIVCDGWKPYRKFTNKIQRCWAHLLREADDLAEKFPESVLFSEALHKIYDTSRELLSKDPPPVERRKIWSRMRRWMGIWLNKDHGSDRVQKFVKKVKSGFDHWFTFILNHEVEPTNNRAERALREHVVQRKIIGTLRNEKGTFIHETIPTVLTTWEQQGLNPFSELNGYLKS